MSRRGVFYAITADEAEQLLALAGNDPALAEHAMGLYSIERQRSHFITGVDKSWDAMHRCLTDGTLRSLGKGDNPLSWCVLGSRSLYGGKDYIVCYVDPQQVERVAEAIDEIDAHWMVSRYRNIGSSGYTGPIDNEDFQYTWDYFTNVRNLYARAAAANRGIVFVADQ